MRFIDKFKALLLDMHGTFVFGHDRFGAHEDFYATYIDVGGSTLRATEVDVCVRKVCSELLKYYRDERYFDRFPQLQDAVTRFGGLTGSEAALVAKVIATHETGHVPHWAAEALQRMSTTHPLSIVSNVWADSDACRDRLRAAGICTLFQHKIFSSDLGCIKPSPRLFLAALDHAGVLPSEALFIGDSMMRDILPAKRLGMATCLVGVRRRASSEVDIAVGTIAELLGNDAACDTLASDR